MATKKATTKRKTTAATKTRAKKTTTKMTPTKKTVAKKAVTKKSTKAAVVALPKLLIASIVDYVLLIAAVVLFMAPTYFDITVPYTTTDPLQTESGLMMPAAKADSTQRVHSSLSATPFL